MAAKLVAGVLALALLAALAALRSSRAEVERYRRELEARPRASVVGPAPPARPAAADPAPVPPDPDPVPQGPPVSAPAPPPTAPFESSASLRMRILDPRLAPEQRIGALRILRFSAPQERGPEVVAAMTALLDTLESGEQRRELCRNLKGVRDPVLREAMLTRLRADPVPSVRAEALDALGAMPGDERAWEGIGRAAREDADAGVRARAERLLAKPR